MNICVNCCYSIKKGGEELEDAVYNCTFDSKTDPVSGNKTINYKLCSEKNEKGTCGDFEEKFVSKIESFFSSVSEEIKRGSFWD